MRLATLSLFAVLIAAPASAQSLLGDAIGTVGSVVSGVADTTSEITGSITGADGSADVATPSSPGVRSGRGAVMPVGTPTKSAGCQRVKFPGLPAATFGVDKVKILTLNTCIEPHVQSVAMVKQVPAIVAALEEKGYDLDDLVTFEAKDDGLLLLYVYKRD